MSLTKQAGAVAKAILRKNKAGGITLPVCYNATVAETVVLAKNQTQRPMEQNRGPRNKPVHIL